MSNVKAQEGQWYLQRWSRETFCVIGVDEDFRVVDVRDENGDVDEFAFEEWETMDLEICMAPEGQPVTQPVTDSDLEADDFEPPNGNSVREPNFEDEVLPYFRSQ